MTGKIKRLEKLNLTGVRVNEPLAKLISETFELPTLIRRSDLKLFERFLKIKDMRNLYVENNINFLGTCLYEIDFVHLQHLEIHNCQRILLTSLISFLTNRNFLKTVILVDCITIDKDMHEAVIAGVHELENLTLKYTKPTINKITQFFEIFLDTDVRLTKVDLEFHSLIFNKIPLILNFTPKVRFLNLKGISLDTVSNFSYLHELEELHMEYFSECEKALVTINSKVFVK